MVADKLYGKSLRLAVQRNADNIIALIHFVRIHCCEDFVSRLDKYPIGLSDACRKIEGKQIDHHEKYRARFFEPLPAPYILVERKDDNARTEDAYEKDILVQEVSNVDRIIHLASGERHDEINAEYLGYKKHQPSEQEPQPCFTHVSIGNVK